MPPSSHPDQSGHHTQHGPRSEAGGSGAQHAVGRPQQRHVGRITSDFVAWPSQPRKDAVKPVGITKRYVCVCVCHRACHIAKGEDGESTHATGIDCSNTAGTSEFRVWPGHCDGHYKFNLLMTAKIDHKEVHARLTLCVPSEFLLVGYV